MFEALVSFVRGYCMSTQKPDTSLLSEAFEGGGLRLNT